MGAGLGLPDEPRPFLNQGLPCLVSRMRFSGDDELHRTLGIAQQTKQTLWVVQ